MQLVLDMSQNVINRTAIHCIANDVDSIVKDMNPIYQYFGISINEKAYGKTKAHLKQLFEMSLCNNFFTINAHSLILKNININAATHSDDIRRLFFDPIYVNYSQLNSQDVVLVLDTSPLVYPHWHNKKVSEAYSHAYAKIVDVKPKILAISHNTAQSMYANFGYGIGDIKVIHLYLPRHFEQDTQNIEPLYAVRPYFLFTGSLETRKNLIGAVESFRLSRLYHEGYQLLLVGGRGHGTEAILERINEVPGVRWCGYLSKEELASYYAGATGFIYPSYLEGFGVPLLEALHFGIPCVATTKGASPEVGGSLIPYADPDDHVSFARSMREIASLSAEERANFAVRSKRRVRDNFSFDAFAASIRSALCEA